MSIAETSHKHHHAHHFNSAEHEYESSKFGLWLFLCTEILMFGGLFVGYIIFHGQYPEAFAVGSKHFLNWRLGAFNTIVLLVSSFTMALSIHYAQVNKPKLIRLNLWITLLCGAIFMVVKYFEYAHKIHEGTLPGTLFTYAGPEMIEHLPMFFSFYFVMTGLHGSHVLAGMIFITWLLIRSYRNEFNSEYFTPLECVGLFWHLVDLIWIYLFPLLYLVG